MNFLAHLYLSGDNTHIQIGNFIGDHVKGRDYEKYAPGIRAGILLHRKIDHFTDRHPIVKQSAQRLNERYGRYSGIVMDVFFDHFLGINWQHYSSVSLKKYVSGVHKTLLSNYFKLPGDVKRFLPFMVKSRRLETYATRDGIARSLQIMSNYSSLPAEWAWAMEQMDKYYTEFDEEFNAFFVDVKEMAAMELEQINV